MLGSRPPPCPPARRCSRPHATITWAFRASRSFRTSRSSLTLDARRQGREFRGNVAREWGGMNYAGNCTGRYCLERRGPLDSVAYDPRTQSREVFPAGQCAARQIGVGQRELRGGIRGLVERTPQELRVFRRRERGERASTPEE